MELTTRPTGPGVLVDIGGDLIISLLSTTTIQVSLDGVSGTFLVGDFNDIYTIFGLSVQETQWGSTVCMSIKNSLDYGDCLFLVGAAFDGHAG
jgi:hypothetical protein